MVDFSLERIYPDTNNNNDEIRDEDAIRLHLERYHYAGKNLITGHVADVACGSGYGSYLLATKYGKNIFKITGVDYNKSAIKYAEDNYKNPLITFVNADLMLFKSSETFSTIISLETIEHLSDPEMFICIYSSQLIKGGRFIASVPVTPSMDANPYHLQDFTASAFRKMFINNGLVEIDSFIQKQHYKPLFLFRKKYRQSKNIRLGLGKYYIKHPGKLLLRLLSFVKDGFTNKYLVVIFEKP